MSWYGYSMVRYGQTICTVKSSTVTVRCRRLKIASHFAAKGHFGSFSKNNIVTYMSPMLNRDAISKRKSTQNNIGVKKQIIQLWQGIEPSEPRRGTPSSVKLSAGQELLSSRVSSSKSSRAQATKQYETHTCTHTHTHPHTCTCTYINTCFGGRHTTGWLLRKEWEQVWTGQRVPCNFYGFLTNPKKFNKFWLKGRFQIC